MLKTSISRFLFCDTSTGVARCVSRIRPGSQCGNFRVNPCFSGVCRNGVCVISSTAPPPTPPPTTPPPANQNPVQSQESCFNENQCCASWAASGECSRNTAYMNEWCKASCGVCKPKYRLADGKSLTADHELEQLAFSYAFISEISKARQT